MEPPNRPENKIREGSETPHLAEPRPPSGLMPMSSGTPRLPYTYEKMLPVGWARITGRVLQMRGGGISLLIPDLYILLTTTPLMKEGNPLLLLEIRTWRLVLISVFSVAIITNHRRWITWIKSEKIDDFNSFNKLTVDVI